MKIGINTIAGVFWGLVLGALLGLIGTGLQGLEWLPANGGVALFFVGFASCIGLGLLADHAEKDD